MNPNYLEYDPSAVKQYASTEFLGFIGAVDYDHSFMHLVSQHTSQAYKKKDLQKVVAHRVRRFVARYNQFVDLVEEGKKEGYIGKYVTKVIAHSSGKKRVVFDPDPRFKKLLQIFTRVLENICFTEFSQKYRLYKYSKFKGNYASYNLYKGKSTVQFKFVMPHKLSIDNILYKMTVAMKKSFSPTIIKLDLKDAYRSTSIDIVKKLLGKKLDKYQVVYDFIMENINMCFIDGSLPPGYPTSSLLFNFVKDYMLRRFKDRKGYIRDIESYADDIYILADKAKGITEYTDADRKAIIKYFVKYIRKWGYRINTKKTDYVDVFVKTTNTPQHRQRSLTPKMKSFRILGKIPSVVAHPTENQVYIIRWQGSNKQKNKLRMLNYLRKKEEQARLSQVDASKDSAAILDSKIKSFESFYFVKEEDMTFA